VVIFSELFPNSHPEIKKSICLVNKVYKRVVCLRKDRLVGQRFPTFPFQQQKHGRICDVVGQFFWCQMSNYFVVNFCSGGIPKVAFYVTCDLFVPIIIYEPFDGSVVVNMAITIHATQVFVCNIITHNHGNYGSSIKWKWFCP
jgi:hypothetical protein